MKRMLMTWRPIVLAATLVALPAFLALCVLSGRCGAQTPTGFQGEPDVTIEAQDTLHGGRVHHANARNFREMVLQAEVPVLVDFYADWCGPCRMLAPVLEELAREMPDARIVKVNVDHSPELAAQYGVSSIPTLIAFRDGRQVDKSVGLVPKSVLRKMLAPQPAR